MGRRSVHVFSFFIESIGWRCSIVTESILFCRWLFVICLFLFLSLVMKVEYVNCCINCTRINPNCWSVEIWITLYLGLHIRLLLEFQGRWMYSLPNPRCNILKSSLFIFLNIYHILYLDCPQNEISSDFRESFMRFHCF